MSFSDNIKDKDKNKDKLSEEDKEDIKYENNLYYNFYLSSTILFYRMIKRGYKINFEKKTRLLYFEKKNRNNKELNTGFNNDFLYTPKIESNNKKIDISIKELNIKDIINNTNYNINHSNNNTYYKTVNKNLNEDIEINKYENKIFLMELKENTIIYDNDISFININEFNFIKNIKSLNPYINYINYLIIIESLSIQEIKNVCKYLNIKWKLLKDKLNTIEDLYIFNKYNFCNFNEIKYLSKKEDVYNSFLLILNTFLNLEIKDINNNIEQENSIYFSINKNNLTLYFFIKYFQEYFFGN